MPRRRALPELIPGGSSPRRFSRCAGREQEAQEARLGGDIVGEQLEGGRVWLSPSNLDGAEHNAAIGEQLWASRYNDPATNGDLARCVAVSPAGTTVFVTSRYAPAAMPRLPATAEEGWWAPCARCDQRGTAGFVLLPALGWRPGSSRPFRPAPHRPRSRCPACPPPRTAGAQLWVSRYDGPASSQGLARSVAVSPAGGWCS